MKKKRMGMVGVRMDEKLRADAEKRAKLEKKSLSDFIRDRITADPLNLDPRVEAYLDHLSEQTSIPPHELVNRIVAHHFGRSIGRTEILGDHDEKPVEFADFSDAPANYIEIIMTLAAKSERVDTNVKLAVDSLLKIFRGEDITPHDQIRIRQLELDMQLEKILTDAMEKKLDQAEAARKRKSSGKDAIKV